MNGDQIVSAIGLIVLGAVLITTIICDIGDRSSRASADREEPPKPEEGARRYLKRPPSKGSPDVWRG